MTQLLALALAAVLAQAPPVDTSPTTSPSSEQQAATTDAEGTRHFRAGHFAEAAALYARAHAEDPQPKYLYHWAQAERRAGNCAVAAQLYRRYLERDPGPENEAAAKKNLARCGYVDAPTPEPPPSTSAPPPRDEDASPPVAFDRGAWLRDPWGITLVALGGGGVLASAILGGGSAAQIRRANDATVEDDYVRHSERAGTLRVAAIATGAIGAALLVGGVTRWLLVRRRHRKAATARGTAWLLTVRF